MEKWLEVLNKWNSFTQEKRNELLFAAYDWASSPVSFINVPKYENGAPKEEEVKKLDISFFSNLALGRIEECRNILEKIKSYG